MGAQDTAPPVELSTDTRSLLEDEHLRPLWEVEEDFGNVYDDLQPDVWRWDDIERAIDAIEGDVDIADLPEGFQRRVAVPINTATGNAISTTIYLGIQTVSPGETAPSHRHGANALRFTINGNEDVKTVVAGEEFPMLENDLITTPQWEWHDHVNESDETAAWLDVLDLPLVLDTLNASNVFEFHELTRQPVTKSAGYWDSQYGRARPEGERDDGSIPGPFEGIRPPTPPYRFQWSETRETLGQRRANDTADPHDGYSMAYVNPTAGHPPLFPTMSLRTQLMDAPTESHFHNSTEVYFAIEGSGATHVGDETLTWSERDIFVVPPDASHHHDPDDEAILLCISDRPVLEAFNFYCEAAE